MTERPPGDKREDHPDVDVPEADWQEQKQDWIDEDEVDEPEVRRDVLLEASEADVLDQQAPADLDDSDRAEG